MAKKSAHFYKLFDIIIDSRTYNLYNSTFNLMFCMHF